MAGNIALIQRGFCSFEQKAETAAAAGAIGAIIFNQGDTTARQGLINGTLEPYGVQLVDLTWMSDS